MEVVGEVVLSALLDPLLGKLTSGEFLNFASNKQVENELKKWRSKLSEIDSVLKGAEEKQITSLRMKTWLSKLRDLAYDVEDILDEFQTEASARKLKREDQASTSSVVRKLLPPCCICLKPSAVMLNINTGSRLQEITSRLEEIVKGKNDFGLGTNRKGRSTGENNRRVTTSLVNESTVFGREKDKEVVLKLLMSSEAGDSSFSVIPIIGIGGIGKTTLAQLVYTDAGVKFDYKAWVCVSDDFDVLRITKTILPLWESCEANDLNKLQERLKEKLSGKKFLIVLDDVWSKNYIDWSRLSVPFAAGAPGSKVVITTRSKDVASKIGSVLAYTLEGVSNEECLHIFTHHALDARNFDAHSDLKYIGVKIAEKCKGLPLVAQTLGGLLRFKQNLQEWEDILHSEMWDLPEEDGGILPALRLSYCDLPSHLKQCFSYCAIFPKDYEFDEKELVLLWMAEGFLQQVKKKKAEDLGFQCFRDLSSRLLFQHSRRNRSKYVMHDSIVDLARSVSQETCFNLGDNRKGTFIQERNKLNGAKIRHSAFSSYQYDTWQRFEALHEMKSVRTFLALPPSLSSGDYHLSNKVLYDLIPALRYLRAVSLTGYSFEELPDSFGDLKHLRYLNLSYTRIRRLPKSLSQLFNLQTLLLRGCCQLVELPKDIGNLINLHYLDISDTHALQEMPLQISALTNLRSLPKFIVGEGTGLGIRGLKKLSHLQGKLCIAGLQNVADSREAELANLMEKQGLVEIALEWVDDISGSQNEREEQLILNSLRPHPSLEKLSITSYGGIEFPSWVGHCSFTKMVDLQLCNCRRITSLPSLERLPVLRHLSIKGMDGVKEVLVMDFSNLETLEIEDMSGWEQWSCFDGLNEKATGKFPRLLELTVGNCPKLTGKLPSCLPSLKKLYIYNCPLLTDLPGKLPSLFELKVEDCPEEIFKSLPDLTSLALLYIVRISGLVCLSEELVQALSGLKILLIEDCKELKYLWQDGTNIGRLANLIVLEISNCNQLESLVEGEGGILPFNLRYLEIKQCDKLKKLPNGLHSLTSLGNLEIEECKQLMSLPEGASLPPNLEHFSVKGCDSLKSFPSAKLPATLKFLTVMGCENVESLPEDKIEISHSHLQGLHLEGLLSVTHIPAAKFCSSLKTIFLLNLKIQSLPSLQSLSHLNILGISECPELESLSPLPNLITFGIDYCGKLRSLPNNINNLISLQTLYINSCCLLESFSEGGLPPNLVELMVINCQNIAQPITEWGLRAITSLQKLQVDFESLTDVDYFPDDEGLLLPTSLTSLVIGFHKDLKSISSGIQHLTSLEELEFYHCPNLHILPKEGFPATLGHLIIDSCRLLEKRCSKDKGDYWPIIKHIPCVEIRGKLQFNRRMANLVH